MSTVSNSLDYSVVAEGLVRFANWWSVQGLWNCGMAFTIGAIFEESYAVRAAIVTERMLHVGRGRPVAYAFCDRAIGTQGVSEENMYYMGYANQRDASGLPCCSCVADAASSAAVFVDTVKAYPDSPRAGDYVQSLRRFCDYVLDKYRNAQGVIQVGILGHRRDVLPDYWCANALFAEVLIGLGEITGEDKYLDAARDVLKFLAVFDYKNTEWREWDTRPTHVAFYLGEGILAGLLSPAMAVRLTQEVQLQGSDPQAAKPAAVQEALNRVKADPHETAQSGRKTLRAALLSRWDELQEWFYRNQQPFGAWHALYDDRCYQAGNSWLFQWAMRGLGPNEQYIALINRQLTYLISRDAKLIFGMFAEPFGSGLALLSFASVAEYCAGRDPRQFDEALRLASKNALEYLW
jgi:hypothetical protein